MTDDEFNAVFREITALFGFPPHIRSAEERADYLSAMYGRVSEIPIQDFNDICKTYMSTTKNARPPLPAELIELLNEKTTERRAVEIQRNAEKDAAIFRAAREDYEAALRFSGDCRDPVFHILVEDELTDLIPSQMKNEDGSINPRFLGMVSFSRKQAIVSAYKKWKEQGKIEDQGSETQG